MFSGTAQVSHQVCQFFVSSVFLLVCMTVVDKNKAVVCCLLTISAIMLSEKKKRKRKMWSKKYLISNISCDAHLLNKLLETDAEGDCLETMPSCCLQVSSRKPTFPSRMTSHSKIAQCNWECIGRLRLHTYSEYVIFMLFHCSNVCVNALQCYVVLHCLSSLVLSLIISWFIAYCVSLLVLLL